DRGKLPQQSSKQSQPVRSYFLVLHHYHYFVEEVIYRLSRGRQQEQCLQIFLLAAVGFDSRTGAIQIGHQDLFFVRGFWQGLKLLRGRNAFFLSLLQDVAHTLASRPNRQEL